jgi:hypothetical protein
LRPVSPPYGHPAWAALGTSGLRVLDLPRDLEDDVIVIADGDAAGEVAARDAAIAEIIPDDDEAQPAECGG